MPIRVVTGPPFAGKSQAVRKVRRQGDILLDTTDIWRSFMSPESVIRSPTDGRIANLMKRKGLEAAVAEGANGWVIVAERDPIRLQKWLDAAGQQKAFVVMEPWDELTRRAKKRGPGCEELLEKWDGYEDDPDFMALTEQWSGEDMRMNMDIETQYRAAVEAVTVRQDGQDVQCRCLTVEAELRADDGDSRVVRGIAVRYGDEARLAGFRERIARGALTLPERKANLTLQHVRAMPLGLLEWQDDEDALRFSSTLTEGPRQDQALLDVRSGLLRGASLEFPPPKYKTLEIDSEKGPLMEILKAQVLRLSLVDDGAYPQSAIRLRVEPMQAARRERTGDSTFVHLGVQPAGVSGEAPPASLPGGVMFVETVVVATVFTVAALLVLGVLEK